MDFSQVEAEFQRLKGQFEAGTLAEAEFKAQLEELMIQDEEGRWWMIGYETGQWYWHDGEAWVRSEPPQVVEERREAEAAARPAEPLRPPTRRVPVAQPKAPARRWIWVAAGLVGLVLLAMLIRLILPGPRLFWAERDVIAPGECTVLRWDVPDMEAVRLYGPGLDPEALLPPGGAHEVCLEGTAEFELKDPDWGVIATVVIEVPE